MTNIEQLTKAFSDFYNGIPWYGKNFNEIIADITPNEALAVAGNKQSITRLLCHMNKWRRAVVIRLQGDLDFKVSDSDADNWPPINTLNKEVWENAKKEFGELQEIIIEELGKRDDEFLDKVFIPEKSRFDYRYLIMGVIQHDIYHLGQISLMKKLLRSLNFKS